MTDEVTMNQPVSPEKLCHYQAIELTWQKQQNQYAQQNSNGLTLVESLINKITP